MPAFQAKTCQGCKNRHRKCSMQTPCEGCSTAGITCHRTVNYKFKLSSGYDFPQNQPWMDSGERIFLSKNGCDSTDSSELINLHCSFPDIGFIKDNDPNGLEYSSPWTMEHDLSPNDIGSLNMVSPLNSISSSHLQHAQFPLSERDSALTRHFFRVLSPRFDYCDLRRQFICEVSARLSRSAILLKAVLAVSAQHLSAFGQLDHIVSDEYNKTALEILTLVKSANVTDLNEDIHAATVILRLRAEFVDTLSGINNQFYLVGTQTFEAYRTLNILSEFQISVAWIGLCQEIRIALISRRPVYFPLDCLYVNWSLTPREDTEWAQMMVLHLAEVLNYCYGTTAKMETYNILIARSQEWREFKPPSFLPLYSHASRGNKRLPRCEILNDGIATGLQHYNLSKIVLALHHPCRQLKPEDTSTIKEIDEVIDGAMRMLCGIGLWNSDCAYAIGLACTGIFLWGDRFSDLEDQKAFQSILDIAKEKHAWRA